MEPPSSILTDGKSKADPRSEDPLSCSFVDNQSSLFPAPYGAGFLSHVFLNS